MYICNNQYKSLVYFYNMEEFANRLQQIISHYGLTASAFADSLDIQRSGISHLLSQRNKPSLDFILKLVDTYPEVDINWITKGEGVFPMKSEISFSNNNLSKNNKQMKLFENEDKKTSPTNLEKVDNPDDDKLFSKKDRKVKKIVFFYDDNQFEIFENE